jgi:hypothetical protein
MAMEPPDLAAVLSPVLFPGFLDEVFAGAMAGRAELRVVVVDLPVGLARRGSAFEAGR